MRFPFRAAAVAGLLIVAGCSARGDNVTPFGGVINEEVVVTVENRNIEDLVVFLVNDGAITRLGTVISMTTSRYPIPPELASIGAIRLHARTIGSSAGYTTQRILVSSGTRIELRLARDLRLSDFSVW